MGSNSGGIYPYIEKRKQGFNRRPREELLSQSKFFSDALLRQLHGLRNAIPSYHFYNSLCLSYDEALQALHLGSKFCKLVWRWASGSESAKIGSGRRMEEREANCSAFSQGKSLHYAGVSSTDNLMRSGYQLQRGTAKEKMLKFLPNRRNCYRKEEKKFRAPSGANPRSSQGLLFVVDR